MKTTTLQLPEIELLFDISWDDYENDWDAVNEMIQSSGADSELVVGICRQPVKAPNGWPVFGITVLGQATARKIVARYMDCSENDPDVDEYLSA